MPISYKLTSGDKFNSKAILRKILYKHIDKDIIERPKMGFGVPLSVWLKDDLKDLVETSFNRKRLTQQGLFNPLYMEKILSSFQRAPKTQLNKIWNLIVFQLWHERWIS